MRTYGLLLLMVVFQVIGRAQEKEPPKFSYFRAEENYDYLKNSNDSIKREKLDIIKMIPLSKDKEVNLNLGGQIRPRVEHYSNRFWVKENDETFYSQRLAFYANLNVGRHIRVFSELYNGYTSHRKEFVEYDELEFHQLFAEYKGNLSEKTKISLRFGRQEMAFGSARLVGFREGPNIRRTFDAGRVILNINKVKIQGFYGKEVRPNFYAFDNDFTLFDGNATNPQLWGVYATVPSKRVFGNQEIYYLGFQSDSSRFNDVSGEETRHTVGLRRFGKLGKRFGFNTELIYQFGEIGDSDISAFNIETDYHYELIHTKWTPSIGLKLEYTSGDRKTGDGKINTFNPMFVNPAYYSLAKNITPANMISIHPSITIKPVNKLKLYAEWGMFWRASKHDGLYTPPRFLVRDAGDVTDTTIGHQIGFTANYEFNRHLSFDLDTSYFIAGGFIEQTGESEDIFHIAPTISYKF